MAPAAIGPNGQILASLRRSTRTVNELAEEVGLTDNAVRSHLAALERDGLVEQHALRRGAGKPAYVYGVTPRADALLPKGYAPVLGSILSVLRERMGAAEVDALLRQAGRNTGEGYLNAGPAFRARVDAAVKVLGELGGVADVEKVDGKVFIRDRSCPLAAVVPDHPEICRVAEGLLTSIIGVPVHERCDEGARPRCCFEVDRASEARGP